MDSISNFLNLDVRLNTSGFSLSDSISRDQKWNKDIKALEGHIDKAENSFKDFERVLSRRYLVV